MIFCHEKESKTCNDNPPDGDWAGFRLPKKNPSDFLPLNSHKRETRKQKKTTVCHMAALPLIGSALMDLGLDAGGSRNLCLCCAVLRLDYIGRFLRPLPTDQKLRVTPREFA